MWGLASRRGLCWFTATPKRWKCGGHVGGKNSTSSSHILCSWPPTWRRRHPLETKNKRCQEKIKVPWSSLGGMQSLLQNELTGDYPHNICRRLFLRSFRYVSVKSLMPARKAIALKTPSQWQVMLNRFSSDSGLKSWLAPDDLGGILHLTDTWVSF